MPINNNEKEKILRAIKTNNLKIKSFESWKNFSKNLDSPNALVLDLHDKASLQQHFDRGCARGGRAQPRFSHRVGQFFLVQALARCLHGG